MPIQIPAFVQYQAPLVPLRGLWNAAPTEGDRFISAELDWQNSPPGNAVQFQLSGNSPVAMSQIVALAVDNAGCGADVQFLFPDSASVLNVPARSSGVFPVFTNALMFYASAPNSIIGDRTVFQAFNSMPPPVQISQSQAQQSANLSGIGLGATGSTPIVPTGVNGTLNSIVGSITMTGGPGSGQIAIYDGAGHMLWSENYASASGAETVIPVSVSGLSLRFINGMSVQVANITGTPAGFAILNLYYSSP